MTKRERFSSGWTGAVAVGLFVYIALAIALILVDGRAWPWLDVFNLYSDSVASICVAVLTGAAARGSADPAARRTWWLLTAALATYSTGNLLHSTYWLYGIDPFPSIGDVFFLGFYPLVLAAVLTVIRTAAVRVQWARLGLDTAILMLGFGAFFWFFVIAPTAAAQRDPNVLKYVLAQSYIALNCLMLLACGVLLMHSGATPIRRRALMLLTLGFSSMSLADIVWAMSKVDGSYIPGSVSDVIYLSCYVWLAAAAREQLRGRPGARRAPNAFSVALIEGMPYIAMMVSFVVLVYVESSTASQPREHDDRHHLRADLAGHGAPGRALARRRAAARTACGRHRRSPLRVPDQERLRRDHDHQRRGNAAIRLAGGRTHLCDPSGRHGRTQSSRSLGRWRQRAAGCIPRRGVGDAWPGRWTDRVDRRDK